MYVPGIGKVKSDKVKRRTAKEGRNEKERKRNTGIVEEGRKTGRKCSIRSRKREHGRV